MLCMSVHPGYSGQAFIPESLERIAKLRSLLPSSMHVQVDGGVGPDEHRASCATPARDAVRRRRRRSSARRPAARVPAARSGARLEPGARARARGAWARIGRADAPARRSACSCATAKSSARAGTQGRAPRTRRSRRSTAAGERARGATLYVSLEPCSHHGTTPPCADAVAEAGVARVVAAVGDPNPKVDGRGFERLRAAGVEVEVADLWEARAQNEAWRVWIARGRPFVTYKVAMTLDGRVTVPGSRWVSGEASRRRVHELRASVDAVAVGMGTVRADDPALTARDVGAVTQPRRLAFGRGPLPEGSELELRSGPLEEELRALGGGRRALAAARRRADARRLVSRGRPGGQAAGVRRADARRRGGGTGRGAPGAARADPADVRARGRGRAPHGVSSTSPDPEPSRTTVRPASSPRRAYPGTAHVSVTLRAESVTRRPQAPG